MLRLTYHGSSTIPIEAEAINPSALAGKSLAEIANLPLMHGNRLTPLGDFFRVAGDPGDQRILIEGDCSQIKRIGAGMTSGRITLQGSVGMHLGAEMSGGDIEIHGQAGDWLGAEMRGGRIHVHGNTGNLVGAGCRGSRRGMRGGVILIDGKAGHEIGATMRRGLIAVGGDVGELAGVNLLAGSLLLFGAVGHRAGAGMKRGSLVMFGPPPRLLPTFHSCCVHEPVFVRIYLKKLQSWNFTAAQRPLGETFARYSGDSLALGKGEILVRRN